MKSNYYHSNVGIIASKSFTYLIVSLFLVRLIVLRLSLDSVRAILLVVFVFILCLISFFVSPRFILSSSPNGITINYSSGESINIQYTEMIIRVFTHKFGIAGFPIVVHRYLRCITKDGKCNDYPLYHIAKKDFDEFASIIIPTSLITFERAGEMERDSVSLPYSAGEKMQTPEPSECENEIKSDEISPTTDPLSSDDNTIFAAVQFPKSSLIKKITKECIMTLLALTLPLLIISYAIMTFFENDRNNSNTSLILNILVAADFILVLLIFYSVFRALDITLHIPQEFRFSRNRIEIDGTVINVSSMTSVTLSPLMMSNVDAHRQRTLTIRSAAGTSRYYLGHAISSGHSLQFDEYDLLYSCITSIAATHNIHIIIETY